MKKTFVVLVAGIIALIAVSNSIQSQPSFEDWAKADMQAFDDFVKADEAAFNAYKADVEKKWREFQESTQEEWVTYGSGKDTKGKVNFEEGYIEIEAVVEASDPNALAKAQEQIATHIEELIEVGDQSGELTASGEKELAEKTVVELKKITPTTPDEKQYVDKKILDEENVLTQASAVVAEGISVLKDMLTTTTGEIVNNINVKSFSKDVAEKAKVEDKSFVGKDGVERLRITVQIPMVPNHLRERAERYLPDVREFCAEYKLDVAMIMALIHTESYFNPKAKSNAPAYGLMQLVPRSGGLDANRYVHNKNEQPSVNFLYKPRNNIQLGTGYLRKMRTAEFKDVKDSQNVLYCIICAYNTGPGNVSKAITGNTNLSKAIPEINKMTPEQLYAKLIKDLPYEETQSYIKKVTERSANYVEWR